MSPGKDPLQEQLASRYQPVPSPHVRAAILDHALRPRARRWRPAVAGLAAAALLLGAIGLWHHRPPPGPPAAVSAMAPAVALQDIDRELATVQRRLRRVEGRWNRTAAYARRWSDTRADRSRTLYVATRKLRKELDSHASN